MTSCDRIWGHLLELVSTKQTTIVITTHYIEEARQAHVVGLMRDGLLLAESAPNALIESHGMETLEEVFLKLCRDQDLPSGPISNAASIKEVDDDDITVAINEKTPLVKKNTSATSQENWSSKIKKRI
jgi:ABC-type multidrug transport system ATPase subunit